MLAIMMLAGPVIYPVTEAQLTPRGQFSDIPATQGPLVVSYTPQPAGLLPPRGPYACPYGHFLDPVRQQCVPLAPGFPGGPQPLPYGQPYDPRVV
ncbi:MAG TPA: hypothetical protein VGJ92_05485 [Methanocella sp.]